jgi:hypothetical protein
MPWLLLSADKRRCLSPSQKTSHLPYPAIPKHLQPKVSDARFSFAIMGILALLLAVAPAQGQVATVSTFQAQVQTAISSGILFNGVTLAATAQWTAGSLQEDGSAKLQASVDGSSNLQLLLTKASRSETQNGSNSPRVCEWTDNAGAQHAIKGLNCMLAIPWFAPSLLVQTSFQMPFMISTTDDGQVTRDNLSFHQISYLLDVDGDKNSQSASEVTPVGDPGRTSQQPDRRVDHCLYLFRLWGLSHWSCRSLLS